MLVCRFFLSSLFLDAFSKNVVQGREGMISFRMGFFLLPFSLMLLANWMSLLGREGMVFFKVVFFLFSFCCCSFLLISSWRIGNLVGRGRYKDLELVLLVVDL